MNKKLTCFMLIFVILLTALPFQAFAASSGRDYNSFIVLTNSYFKLNPNDKIYSANKEYCLSFQEDGNLVIYNVANAWEAIWSAPGAWNNTDHVMFYEYGLYGLKYLDIKKAFTKTSFKYPVQGGKYLCMQDDGALTICDKEWKPLWSSKGPLYLTATDYDTYTTNRNLNTYDKIYSPRKEYCLRVEENGKYAIYDLTKSESKPIWETSEIWNDNVKYGKYLCMQDDGVLAIYDSSWKKIWSHKEHYLYSKQTACYGAETSLFIDINGKVTGKTTCWNSGVRKYTNFTNICILDKTGKTIAITGITVASFSGECKAFSKKTYSFQFNLTEEQKNKIHSVEIFHQEMY